MLSEARATEFLSKLTTANESMGSGLTLTISGEAVDNFVAYARLLMEEGHATEDELTMLMRSSTENFGIDFSYPEEWV